MLFTLEGRLGIGQRGLVLLELSLGDRKGRLVLVDDRLIRAILAQTWPCFTRVL